MPPLSLPRHRPHNFVSLTISDFAKILIPSFPFKSPVRTLDMNCPVHSKIEILAIFGFLMSTKNWTDTQSTPIALENIVPIQTATFYATLSNPCP